jgi:hypothetical protein
VRDAGRWVALDAARISFYSVIGTTAGGLDIFGPFFLSAIRPTGRRRPVRS